MQRLIIHSGLTKFNRILRIITLTMSLFVIIAGAVPGRPVLAQSITLSPSYGFAGSRFTVMGSDFHGYENVYAHLCFSDNQTKTIRVSENGSFAVDFFIPRDTTPGIFYDVTIEDEDGKRLARDWFFVAVGAPGSKPGSTYLAEYVTSDGTFTQGISISSLDGQVTLSVAKGTVGLIEEEPLSEISIVSVDTETGIEGSPIPPTDAHIVGSIYDITPDGTTFEPPITLSIAYQLSAIPAGVSENSLVIALWDGETQKWVELEGCSINPITHTISAPLSHFTAFAVLAYTRPAAFTVSDLSISPTEVDIREEVTISVLVTNNGDLSSSYEVNLKIDNVVVGTKDITLNGGASDNVTFTTFREVAGSYQVDVNNLSGSFVVKATPTSLPASPATSASANVTPGVPPVSPEPIRWWLVSIIIVGVLIIGLGIYWLRGQI